MTEKELPNVMNNFFISVGPYPLLQAETGNYATSTRTNFASTITLAPTTPNEVATMKNNLENNISAGIEEI